MAREIRHGLAEGSAGQCAQVLCRGGRRRRRRCPTRSRASRPDAPTSRRNVEIPPFLTLTRAIVIATSDSSGAVEKLRFTGVISAGRMGGPGGCCVRLRGPAVADRDRGHSVPPDPDRRRHPSTGPMADGALMSGRIPCHERTERDRTRSRPSHQSVDRRKLPLNTVTDNGHRTLRRVTPARTAVSSGEFLRC